MDHDKDSGRKEKLPSPRDDPLFSGRGAPAFMSPKEPAIRLLRERYSESFALVPGSGDRIHLFLVKVGLWALVRTFVPKSLSAGAKGISLDDALKLIENALNGGDPNLLENLDSSVARAKSRIKDKTDEFGLNA
jgi:hypothetical protein